MDCIVAAASRASARGIYRLITAGHILGHRKADDSKAPQTRPMGRFVAMMVHLPAAAFAAPAAPITSARATAICFFIVSLRELGFGSCNAPLLLRADS